MIALTETFGEQLSNLRRDRNLTVQQLADRAGVPATLISGLQTNSRQVGENNARKIAEALHLSGKELDQFVYAAINTSAERVLESSKGYPAEMLNFLANELRQSGIMPENVMKCVLHPHLDDDAPDALLFLNNGSRAAIRVNISNS
jgi:transcriptional regulator with XRE-family HTH domain